MQGADNLKTKIEFDLSRAKGSKRFYAAKMIVDQRKYLWGMPLHKSWHSINSFPDSANKELAFL